MTRSDRADLIAGALAEALEPYAPGGLLNEERGLVQALAWQVAKRFPQRGTLKLRLPSREEWR